MTLARLPAFLAVAGLATSISCRVPNSTAIDPDMADCVPPGTAILAGLNLDQLRASPLYQRLPEAVRLLTEPLRDARYVLLAYDDRNLISIASGKFREPPPGAVLLARNLAVAGPSDLIRAATAQHRAGRVGVPDLFSRAESLAAANQIWIVVRGGITLPLTGNAANLNRLLHATEQATIAIQVAGSVGLDVTGYCRTADAARDFEQSVRAMVSLAAAGARQPDVAAWLHAVQIGRDDRTVHIKTAASIEAIDALLKAF